MGHIFITGSTDGLGRGGAETYGGRPSVVLHARSREQPQRSPISLHGANSEAIRPGIPI